MNLQLVTDHADAPVGLSLDGRLSHSPARSVDRAAVLDETQEEPVLETYLYDPSRHRQGMAAHDDHGSGHRPVSCPQPSRISLQDPHGRWQSGCQRAVDELTTLGEIP